MQYTHITPWFLMRTDSGTVAVFFSVLQHARVHPCIAGDWWAICVEFCMSGDGGRHFASCFSFHV